jgi:hypothetical protein
MVLVRLGGPSVTWDQSETRTRGYEHAEVRLRFTSGVGQGDAACYYRYDAVDDTALTLADPLAAYSTSPSRMVLDGKELSRSVLAQTVKDAMLKQGRALVDEVGKGFR